MRAIKKTAGYRFPLASINVVGRIIICVTNGMLTVFKHGSH